MSKAQKLTGYDLTERLRRTRKRHYLTSTEQALYYELVAICKEAEWVDVFTCSNPELCQALNITENTLVTARMALINANLLYYSSGKSKRQFSSYSFVKKLSGSGNLKQKTKPTTVEFEVDAGANTGGNPGANAATVTEDYNKSLELDQTEVENSAAEAARQAEQERLKIEEEERKKAAAQKKKEDEAKTPHWSALVKTWFDFYQDKCKAKPTFRAKEGALLKDIADRLQRRSKEDPLTCLNEWTEEYASNNFYQFLSIAWMDKWIKQKFMLSNLSSQFDSITQPKNEPGTSKTAAGRTNADIERELDERLASLTGQSR